MLCFECCRLSVENGPSLRHLSFPQLAPETSCHTCQRTRLNFPLLILYDVSSSLICTCSISLDPTPCHIYPFCSSSLFFPLQAGLHYSERYILVFIICVPLCSSWYSSMTKKYLRSSPRLLVLPGKGRH